MKMKYKNKNSKSSNKNTIEKVQNLQVMKWKCLMKIEVEEVNRIKQEQEEEILNQEVKVVVMT